MGGRITVGLSPLIPLPPFLIVTTFRIHLSAEHIQAVAHMQHGIAVHTIVFRIASTSGIHPMVEVALLSKQIVEVQGNDQGFTLQERL